MRTLSAQVILQINCLKRYFGDVRRVSWLVWGRSELKRALMSRYQKITKVESRHIAVLKLKISHTHNNPPYSKGAKARLRRLYYIFSICIQWPSVTNPGVQLRNITLRGKGASLAISQRKPRSPNRRERALNNNNTSVPTINGLAK